MKKYLGLIFILIFINITQAYSAKNPILKVRIAKSLKKVFVSGDDLKRYIWPKKSYKKFSGHKKIQFNCVSKNRKKVKKPIRLASIKSKSGLVSLGREKYKGILHIQTDENLNGCDVINEITLEDYISTLLPKEMSTNWPIEALKAQAVAARSYAYYKAQTAQVSKTKGFKTNYDLESSEKHQVSGSYFDATKKTLKATNDTNGEILSIKNSKKLTPIFFHSKCGGKTLTPDQVWKNKIKGYVSVDCPFCHKHGRENWKHKFSKTKMIKIFGNVLKKFNKDSTKMSYRSVKLVSDLKSRTKIRFYNNGDLKIIKKSKLRSIIGRKGLPSNYFKISVGKKKIIITGSGYGHGVGMCQFGAKELALQGYNYKEILAHYFPKMRIYKIY